MTSFYSYPLVATFTLSAFKRPLSTVLRKFSSKKLISFGCHSQGGVTRGGRAPSLPPLVTPLAKRLSLSLCT